VAHASHPSIHDVTPDDIEVTVLRDQQLAVCIHGAGGALTAGHVFVAGCSDRERLENLLAIAGRLRQATLDLIAQLNDEGAPSQRGDVHRAAGDPPAMPDAAPLHGTTTRASVVTL
jgi:hypothetical protein